MQHNGTTISNFVDWILLARSFWTSKMFVYSHETKLLSKFHILKFELWVCTFANQQQCDQKETFIRISKLKFCLRTVGSIKRTHTENTYIFKGKREHSSFEVTALINAQGFFFNYYWNSNSNPLKKKIKSLFPYSLYLRKELKIVQ